MAWTRTQIDQLLRTNPLAVERAMVRLYELQTNDEKMVGQTRWHNGQGFAAYAGKRGSYYAKWVLSGRHLTGPHLQKALAIALRHSGQLVNIANSK